MIGRNWIPTRRIVGAIFVALGVVASVAAISVSRFHGDSDSDTVLNDREQVPGPGFRLVNFDLGVVAPESRTERVVTITNDSSKVCTVKGVWNDCGCIVHELNSPVAAPGASWELKFRYRAPAKSGLVSQRMILRFKEDGVDPVMVQVRGRVRRWAEPWPDEVSFGRVMHGREVVKNLQVFTPSADQQLAGDPVVTGVPWVTVRVVSSDPVVSRDDDIKGTLHRFRLVFAPPADAPAADYQGEIKLAGTPGDAVVSVRCRAGVMPRISASPEEAFFGLVAPGATKTCTIRLRFHDPELRQKASDLMLTAELGSEFKAALADAESAEEVLLNVEVVRPVNDRSGIRAGALKITGAKGVSLNLPVRAWFE